MASGQHDSSRSTNFLQYTTNEDLTTDSKRVYILFTVYWLGKTNEDTSMLRMTTKLIGEDDAGYEEGVPSYPDGEESITKRTRRSQGNSWGVLLEGGNLSKGLNRVGSSSVSRAALLRDQMLYQRSNSESHYNNEAGVLEWLERQNHIMDLLEESALRYDRAWKINNSVFIDSGSAMEENQRQFELSWKASKEGQPGMD